MKKTFSLRKKLFIQIGGLAIILVLLLYLANTFFLEPYYINQTKKDLIESYQDLENSNLDIENLDILELLDIQSSSNAEIVITDSSRHLIYSSIGYMNNNPVPDLLKQGSFTKDNNDRTTTLQPKRPIPEIILTETEPIDNDSKFTWGLDPITNTKLLILEGSFNENYHIELRVALLSIHRTNDLINTFILYTGLILFLVALFIAFLISKYFTDPIKEITSATDRIQELDFETIINVKTNDELGSLSHNINKMNETLKSTFQDLSKTNEELQHEIVQKTKLDLKRKELLNSVSHELKTPLSILQGYAEALSSGIIKDKEKVDFYCQVITDEANKTNLLLSQLLDINQLEFGDIQLNKSRIEFGSFITYLIEKLTQQNQIQLTLLSQIENNIIIYADPLRLEQVITNYIQNAMKYVDEKKIIQLSWNMNNNHLRFNIYNSHEYLDEKVLDQLFDSFYKADVSRTRSKGGYGLGLSIVKAIQIADNNVYGAENVTDGINFYAEFDLFQD